MIYRGAIKILDLTFVNSNEPLRGYSQAESNSGIGFQGLMKKYIFLDQGYLILKIGS